MAVQLEVASVTLNVAVKHATIGQGSFPPADAAYILFQSSEPGRGTNSYIVGHALQHLFKRLWNVQLGAEVKILMSDGVVLRYLVTEIHPNVALPRRARRPDAVTRRSPCSTRRPAARGRGGRSPPTTNA